MEQYTVRQQKIESDPDRIHGLGRNVNHDSRSRFFAYVAPTSVQLKTTIHQRNIPVLNQGALGSCTGNATVGAIGTTPNFEAINKLNVVLDEELAVAIYGDATIIDPFSGAYPPEDTGSDGLSVAKVAKKRGLISGYTHAFDLNSALVALMNGPLITGTNWYSSFDYPNSDGTVTISPGAQVEGGHEYCAYGIDVEKKEILLVNSWGPRWGNAGTFRMSWDTWGRLLSEQGDVTIFVPLTQAPPTPSPTPVPTADEVFAKKAKAWLSGNPWFYRGSIQQYTKDWLKAKGY